LEANNPNKMEDLNNKEESPTSKVITTSLIIKVETNLTKVESLTSSKVENPTSRATSLTIKVEISLTKEENPNMEVTRISTITKEETKISTRSTELAKTKMINSSI